MTYGANILVVDDTPANLQLLTRMLSKEGYEVRPARNGELALLSAKAKPPDIILLDVMMPGLSGYEVCEELKSRPETCSVPIIFVSALDNTLDKIRAFTAGGVDYVTKPFQTEEVLARVRTHLEIRELQRRLESQNAQLRREIAERQRAERELAVRAAELEERNDELDAFSHTVAHDLKAPLASVVGYAELLDYEGFSLSPKEQREAHQAIAHSSKRMVRIIDSLLLLAQIRHAEVTREPVDILATVSEALDRLRERIAASEATVHQPDRWPPALGYTPWIEEIWTNYISNAIKYGGRPPVVTLGVTHRDDGQCEFWVRDNGQGLNPDQQARLFTPFTRLNQVDIKGHGLGLSIVRRIADKMGGEVGAHSTVGQGSTFYFTLATQ